MKNPAWIGILGLITVVGTSCRTEHRVYVAVPPPQRTGCHVHGAFPDSVCTPGAWMTHDLKVICSQSTAARRDVGEAEKRHVFAEYGIVYPPPRGAYEVDHFIPLELGGSNAISNLWPEAAKPVPGFHEKDKVENYLHRQVCSGSTSLEEARKEITTNWLEVYQVIR